MTRLRRLLVLTFIESLATVLFERGIYFFTKEQLAFSDAMNLALALVFGVAYVAGAMASHGVSHRIGEKTLLRWSLIVQIAAVLTLMLWPVTGVVYVAAVVLGACNGIKWPVVESYVGAGWTVREQAAAIGRFNVGWSSAVPAALIIAGPLIGWKMPWASQGAGLFAAAGICSIASMWLMRRLPAQPAHMPHDHPDRPPAELLTRWRGLLWASRWLMLASYSLLFVMAPLMPAIFERLGFSVTIAPGLSSVVDIVRLASFILLQWYTAWHGRIWPILAVIVFMPIGFFMVVTGDSTAIVLAGELLFGVAAGLSYYAALYYAMVVKNASVDAGGVHEGLIGAGFFLGPLAGLLATRIGFLPGVGPLILVCTLAGLWSLRPMLRQRVAASSTTASGPTM